MLMISTPSGPRPSGMRNVSDPTHPPNDPVALVIAAAEAKTLAGQNGQVQQPFDTPPSGGADESFSDGELVEGSNSLE